MKHWLMKSEPSVFGIDDLAKAPKRTSGWDGVRNYQVRNMLRDEFAVGDLAFFYHSSCPEPGIVGVMEVVRAGYPDGTALDPAVVAGLHAPLVVSPGSLAAAACAHATEALHAEPPNAMAAALLALAEHADRGQIGRAHV